MSDTRPCGGAVVASAVEVLKLARTAFCEDCDLLVSILQASDTISANTYLNEDSPCITKRYAAGAKELGLKMLRNPVVVAQRLRDPTVVPQDGGAVTARPRLSRVAPEATRATRITILRDSTLTWHQGLSKKNITRIDSLELIMRRFGLGGSSVNIDWKMTHDLYEFGGDVNKRLQAVDKQHPRLAARPSEGQTLIWFDAGNTWAHSNIPKANVKNAHIAAYRQLAHKLALHVDRIL